MKNLSEIIENMISKQNVSFISSVDEDGYPNTKAMLAPVKQEGIKTFYWHTNSLSVRVKQYRNNPKACIYFCDEHSFQGVMLKGTMEVVDDPDTKKYIWKDDFSVYYQGGMDGGDFTLLRFTAESGRYYSNFNSESFIVDKENRMNEQICQSCGMNMKTAEDFGTNGDGTPNQEYCNYCYQNGAFTRDVTMEEMLETNLKYLDHWNAETGNDFTVEEARPMLREFLATLKRWKKLEEKSKQQMKIISVRETPEYKNKAIDYISSKWPSVSRIIYDDSITHSITTSSFLPQWYLLENDDEIIGCAGLITNDFISRMDLYPWVCALFIEEKHRGNQYSSLLLEKAKEDSKKAGFVNLYLSTYHIGFYEKYGFHYIGQGYHPWGEDSRIYEIKL